MNAMNRTMFSIVLLTLLAHACIADIAMNTTKPQDFDRLSRAAVDIATTCYGDPGNAIGIIGDRDGSILKALRLNHFTPVVLVNDENKDYGKPFSENSMSHKLHVFIVAIDSPMQVYGLLKGLQRYIWWNYDANFLIVDKRAEPKNQCYGVEAFMFLTTLLGLLNAQCICQDRKQRSEPILIWTSNPFVPRAPEVWTFVREYKLKTAKYNPNGFLFMRLYREGGQSCKSINFPKASNVGRYRIAFVTYMNPTAFSRYYRKWAEQHLERNVSVKVTTLIADRHVWLVRNIARALNSTAMITRKPGNKDPTVYVHPIYLSNNPKSLSNALDNIIVLSNQMPYFAVTQHTGHMTQLDKILSVIDGTSRISMWAVYLITFLFFKFFLRQAVIPALLNLVRLTCNTGLTTLPNNVAATLYLTCLFMFVVTLQAIYTGNLATLLTTTIPYQNVQRKEDIPKLGYKVYMMPQSFTKFTADPMLDACIIKVPYRKGCVKYVLRDPLGVCVGDDARVITYANQYNLHVTRDALGYDYTCFATSNANLVKSRIEEVLKTLNEAGIYRPESEMERLRLQFVDDDEVKKNTERRVMTFEDLRFTFVILGLGLACATVCFIGEIVICRIHLMYEKRRDRVRVRSAWGVTAKKYSWFSSLNCRFNLRRFFSNRR